MISRLKLSHFAIIATDSQKEAKRPSNVGAPGGETGIDARVIDGKALVTSVAVLTDGLTGSSAEFVAVALQEMGRACVIGTRTKGEALPAEYTTLPNGDVFLCAVADFVTGAGKRLEGVGVAPDIEVALSQGSLLEGRDIVLEAAVDWIRTQD